MIIPTLINNLHKLVFDFSQQTNAIEVEFVENKKLAEWSVKYNIIKLQFVLTKKEKIACPISTLFCRVYLGKNEAFFYHLPELMEYLEPDNYKSYYFPYIESEERLEACFGVLAAFLKKYIATINALAKSTEKSELIKATKKEELIRIFTEKEPEKEMEEYFLSSYEELVLLLRNAGDGAYREFLCGNYEKAWKLYEEIDKKGKLTSYEKRLCVFLKERKEEYIALPEECNTLREVKKVASTSAESKAMLRAALVCELVFGSVFAGIVVMISAILSAGTVHYAGMPWYYAFVFAGIPAIFGGIAFRNGIGKPTDAFEKLLNPQWAENLAKLVFGITLPGMLLITVCTSFMSTRFYEENMTYEAGEDLLPINETTCYYADLKNVYYSEGLYNIYGDYIARPSYLLEFEDGTVWDSDGCTSVEVVEEHILPIIDDYYDEIRNIKASNEIIE